jgi:hypothetical protein
MSSEITGADIVVRCLAEEGVEHVFGYPGGAIMPNTPQCVIFSGQVLLAETP